MYADSVSFFGGPAGAGEPATGGVEVTADSLLRACAEAFDRSADRSDRSTPDDGGPEGAAAAAVTPGPGDAAGGSGWPTPCHSIATSNSSSPRIAGGASPSVTSSP